MSSNRTLIGFGVVHTHQFKLQWCSTKILRVPASSARWTSGMTSSVRLQYPVLLQFPLAKRLRTKVPPVFSMWINKTTFCTTGWLGNFKDSATAFFPAVETAPDKKPG